MIKRPLLPLLGASLFAVAFVAPLMAQTTTTGTTDTQVEAQATMPASRLVGSYTDLAGSEANAKALIDGLRNGTAISLSTDVTTTTTTTNPDGTTTTTTSTAPVATSITPVTGKMGWGEVNITLALAQALVGPDATAEQLQAALNGGTLTNADGTTTTLAGVLQLRADGMGWGQIAKQLGFKLGALISASHTGKSPAGSKSASGKASARTAKSTARSDKAGARTDKSATHSDKSAARSEKSAARSDRSAARVEKPARLERVQRAERPERAARPERPSRPERRG